ncbi:hypothetical protein [Rubrivirga marina]|uniref:Lipoprotein n=1 Tax=Rubrivirga marina TaxID=1196024 RepID=A0A271J588_9BACT|nr:hypothetical protein [Rubrivirga marina]PAP78520.1 hypothetical protein BSZ37_19865 [Rubrivirga marina]
MGRVPAAILLGALLIGCEAPPPETPRLDDEGPPDVVGTWAGEVEEDGLRYKLLLTIDHLEQGADAGKTAYTGGLDCTGTLTYEGADRRVLSFREDLHGSPNCADGRIDVRLRSDGRLGWTWYRSDADRVPDARATLDRE